MVARSICTKMLEVREFSVDDHIGVEPELWTEAKSSLVQLSAKGSKRFTNHDPACLEAVGKFSSRSANLVAGAEAHIQRNLESFAKDMIEAFPNTSKVHEQKVVLVTMRAAIPTAADAGLCLLNVDACLREPSTHEATYTALRDKYISDLDRLFEVATQVCDLGQPTDTWKVEALTELLAGASGDIFSTLLLNISRVATTRVTASFCKLWSCHVGSFDV